MGNNENLKRFITKTGRTIKKTAITVGAKAKNQFIATKKNIEDSIEAREEAKRIRYENEVRDYKIKINDFLATCDNEYLKVLIKKLEPSPAELTRSVADKIKKEFPIPREQLILWSYYVSETTRSGGIAITNKGIIIKTVVSVFDEKALKKENRKVSELLYLKWDNFDFSCFSSKKVESALNTLGESNVFAFKKACLSLNELTNNAKISSSNYYKTDSQILAGVAVSASGVALKSSLKFTRDNGVGNNPNAGFGFFAEQANNSADILQFKNAKVVGGDNAKNGPDRFVNGVNIQTKYYATGARSVGATFDNKGTGNYRYWNKDGTPMKLEVPKGQGPDAIKTFKNKIIQGKVRTTINGKEYVVTDPNVANEVIVEGHYSMDQVKAMAKAGTIESLVYDLKTGAVTSLCVFGISFLIDSYLCYRKTKNMKESVVSGLCAGGKAGILSLSTHILISQLSRTKFFSEILTKSVIRSGAAYSAIGFVVFSIPETFDFATRRISGSQYAANLAILSASIVGGTAGAYVGGTLGTALGTAAGAGAGSVPLAIAGGTGGVVGGVVVGSAIGVGTSKVIDIFFEGDDKRLARLFNAITCNMFIEYLLTENEIEMFIDKMNKTSSRKIQNLFKDVMRSNEQENTIREFLKVYFEEIVQTREKWDVSFDGIFAM